jgi:alpha-mannosidase
MLAAQEVLVGMSDKITVHMIGNAHLDPVWQWQKAQGIDAVLATARSACDRLDEYDDFVFTCSASWFHQVVEQLDEALFARIRQYVADGRWALVGGMVIQPDCNLPSAESFRKQLKLGQGYYKRAFGLTTRVGYNVDSFGHTPYLPSFLREAGIDSYVFMRPSPPLEKLLPQDIFRWRSPDGAEVATYRIPKAYCTRVVDISSHVQAAIDRTPEGLCHTMCFFGVGDHGGGPTREQIDWIIANTDAFAGARLVFSHPRAYFDAIADKLEMLPVVTDELQHHAIGCYSVERRIKIAMRQAEAALGRAERVVARLSDHAPPDARQRLDHAWDQLMLNEFHDILGGTSLDAANERAAAEMLAAASEADEVATATTRKAFRELAKPGRHRIVAYNPFDHDFRDNIEFNPWLMGKDVDLSLEDGRGQVVPSQQITPETITNAPSLLFEASVPAGSERVIELVDSPRVQAPPPGASFPASVEADAKRVDFGERIAVCGWRLGLEVFDDPTDTWSHSSINSFRGQSLGDFAWVGRPELYERGPMRWSLRRQCRFGDSRAWVRVFIEKGKPCIRLQISAVWAQLRQRLVLRLSGPAELTGRIDLVSGGPFGRDVDGLEYPLCGGTVISTGESSMAVTAPDIFSVSAAGPDVAFTLLRSPYMVHHRPTPPDQHPDQPATDQGRHDFDLRLWPGAPMDGGQLAHLYRETIERPIVWDVTG